jgi:TldD protein
VVDRPPALQLPVFGQTFHEIRGGKVIGMLKDVAYQANTPQFWNSMDMIGGKSTYWLGGSFGDGKVSQASRIP